MNLPVIKVDGGWVTLVLLAVIIAVGVFALLRRLKRHRGPAPAPEGPKKPEERKAADHHPSGHSSGWWKKIKAWLLAILAVVLAAWLVLGGIGIIWALLSDLFGGGETPDAPRRSARSHYSAVTQEAKLRGEALEEQRRIEIERHSIDFSCDELPQWIRVPLNNYYVDYKSENDKAVILQCSASLDGAPAYSSRGDAYSCVKGVAVNWFRPLPVCPSTDRYTFRYQFRKAA